MEARSLQFTKMTHDMLPQPADGVSVLLCWERHIDYNSEEEQYYYSYPKAPYWYYCPQCQWWLHNNDAS